MATYKNDYIASAAMTITLASLGSSSTLVAGRESDAYDNSSNEYPEIFISGKITLGTSPTVNKLIEVWVIPELEDSSWPDVFDGTDSAETATSRDILAACGKCIKTILTDATSDRTYPIGKESLRKHFGTVPRKFVVFVTHNTGVNLNSTGSNQAIYVQGVTGQSA